MTEPFRFRHRVAFHETDAAGIAHFSNTPRWVEMAEHAMLRSLGTSVFLDDGEGGYLSYPRVDLAVTYRAPLRFEEELEVRFRVDRIGRSSLTYGFEVASVATGVSCSVGSLTVVCSRRTADGTLASVPLPAEIASLLRARWPDAG